MGLVFADAGLHLAVLGKLLVRELVSAEALEALIAAAEKEHGDADDVERDRIRRAVRTLHDFAMSEADAATITSLNFDGGNDIYMLIEGALDVDTGGESDHYTLGSLAGMGALAKLEKLDLGAYGYRRTPLDLAPLANHPALAKLELSGPCTAAATLETLPRLAELDLGGATLDDPAALDRLASRGVTVKRGR